MKKIRIPILAVLILLLSNIGASAGENRTIATAIAAVSPLIPAFVPISVQERLGRIEEWFFDRYILAPQGLGQLYNGQYLKAGGYLLNAIIGNNLVDQYHSGPIYEDTSYLNWYLGYAMIVGGYVLSIRDANLSAKKNKQQRLKSGPSNLNSAPAQILVGNYNFRF